MNRNPAVDLFVANRNALVAYAREITGDRGHAEDLVQEAWLRFEKASHRALLEKPLGYLYRIVHNLALDRRRKERHESHVFSVDSLGTAADILPDKSPSPEATALYKDEMKVLINAIAELPERTRVAVEMHHSGCRLREIAAFLSVSVAMAHILVADGVQHCKHRLNWP